MIVVTSIKIVPPPTESSWCQVFEFKPNSFDSLTKRGQVALLIFQKESLQKVSGHDLWESFHSSYFQSDKQDAFDAFKKAFEEAKKQDPLASLGAVAYRNNTIYAALYGDCTVCILRQGELTPLLTGNTKMPRLISGHVNAGDTIFLATTSILKKHPFGVIKAALMQSDLESTSEMLAPLLLVDPAHAQTCFVMRFQTQNEITKTVAKTPSFATPLFTGRVKGALVRAIDKILSLIPQSRQKVYVHSVDPFSKSRGSKKSAAAVGFILLLLLSISVAWGIRRSEEKRSREQYESRLVEAQHKLSEAKELKDLYPPRAKSLLSESRSIVNQLTDEGVTDPRLDQLKVNLDESFGSIAGVYQVEAELYLDLSLVSSGMKGDRLRATAGRILVLDTSAHKLVSITTETKRTQVLAQPSLLSSAKDTAGYVNRSFILSDEGVVEIADSLQTVIKKDWGEGLILAYAGNIYVLDKQSKEIYRYAGSGNSFGSKNVWLPKEFFPEGEIISWAIDGSMWILDGGGSVYKFTTGRPDSFFLQNESNITPAAFFADEETKSLYLLDKVNGRVIVSSKQGSIQAEYYSDIAKQASGIVVSEKEKKIILLVDSKLYSLSLKHL